jgi:hypothetical protein
MTSPTTKPDTGMAHTAGPWTATNIPWPEQIGCCPLVGRPFSIHRDVDHRNVAAATTFANARLIAAAPELAAMVQELLTIHEAHHNHPTHAAARRILAKATGAKP